jgi:hypothetical protein
VLVISTIWPDMLAANLVFFEAENNHVTDIYHVPSMKVFETLKLSEKPGFGW